MNIIKNARKTYCDWLDEMGLTPENKRCCVPLDEQAQKALRGEQASDISTDNKKQKAKQITLVMIASSACK